MENKKIVEYYPSNEGLKNIYSKFLYIEDGEDEEMAQFIVDYFEYIYGKRGEEE